MGGWLKYNGMTHNANRNNTAKQNQHNNNNNKNDYQTKLEFLRHINEG